MLSKELTILINRNVELLKYCNEQNIDLEKLSQCYIEKMGNEFLFCLSKENVPVSTQILPLDIDIATQPDVVLIIRVEGKSLFFETTEKTNRILHENIELVVTSSLFTIDL